MESKACEAPQYEEVEELIDNIINSDITYQQKPLELRYQRIFAVKVSYWNFASSTGAKQILRAE